MRALYDPAADTANRHLHAALRAAERRIALILHTDPLGPADWRDRELASIALDCAEARATAERMTALPEALEAA